MNLIFFYLRCDFFKVYCDDKFIYVVLYLVCLMIIVLLFIIVLFGGVVMSYFFLSILVFILYGSEVVLDFFCFNFVFKVCDVVLNFVCGNDMIIYNNL